MRWALGNGDRVIAGPIPAAQSRHFRFDNVLPTLHEAVDALDELWYLRHLRRFAN